MEGSTHLVAAEVGRTQVQGYLAAGKTSMGGYWSPCSAGEPDVASLVVEAEEMAPPASPLLPRQPVRLPWPSLSPLSVEPTLTSNSQQSCSTQINLDAKTPRQPEFCTSEGQQQAV